MTRFVGERQHALVTELMARLDGLCRGEELPRLVLFEAESGVGKSRIIREFYELLRSRQSSGEIGEGYWPPLPEQESSCRSPTEPLPHRKVLAPPIRNFRRPQGAIPTFSWFALNCADAGNGFYIDVAQLLRPELSAHARFLAFGLKRATSSKQQFNAWMKENKGTLAKDFGESASLELIGHILAVVLGVTLPMTGYGVEAGIASATLARRQSKTRRDIETGGLLDIDGVADATALVQELKRLAAARMPMMLVVEDLHLADESLGRFLMELAAHDPEHPVMVLASAWPEGMSRAPYRRLRAEMSASPHCQIFAGEEYPRLGAVELREIVLQMAGAEPAVLDAVVAKWPNPLALQLALTDEDFTTEHLFEGRLEASPRDLEQLPTEIRDLYYRRWKHLPRRVQESLRAAAGCCGQSEAGTNHFIPQEVAEAAASAGLITDSPASVLAGLDEALSPYAWTRQTSWTIQNFREASLEAIARSHLAEGRRERLRAELLRNLESFVLRTGGIDPRSEEQLARARWLLALEPAESEATAMAALGVAESLEANPAKALALLPESRISLLESRPDRGLYLRQALAMWCMADGRPVQALEHLHRAIAFAGELGRMGEANLMRQWKAVPLAELGYFDEAIAIHESILHFVEQTGADGHAAGLARFHREYLARALVKAGRPKDALKVYDAVVGDVGPLPAEGLIDARLLPIYAGYAQALDHVGRTREATGLLRELVERNPLPQESQVSLTLVSNLATSLAREGDPEAGRLLEEVAERRWRSLGPTHPQTLAAQSKFLRHALDQGDRSRLGPLLSIYEEQLRTGEPTMAVVETAYELTSALKAESDGQDAALDVAQRLFRVLRPSFTPEEVRSSAERMVRRVQSVRNPFAELERLQGLALDALLLGRSQQAYELYLQLGEALIDTAAGHAAVVGTRANAIVAYAQAIRGQSATPEELASRADSGLDQIRDLMPDLEREFGAEHELVVTLRRTRVLLLVQARRLRSAREELAELVPLMTRLGHREGASAVEQLEMLEGAWELCRGRHLRSIRQRAATDPSCALSLLADAAAVLRTARILTEGDMKSVNRSVVIARGLQGDSRAFSQQVGQVTRILEQLLKSDFER